MVVTDFGKAGAKKSKKAKQSEVAEAEEADVGGEGPEAEPWGIYALPLDYEPIKEYVAKSQGVFEFEREGECVVCQEAMSSGEGLHAICTNEDCEGVGHLSCWGRHLLRHEDAGEDGVLLPIDGQCPRCKGQVQWADMMKELTLRTRGQKDVEKLLKTKRKRATKAKASAQATQATQAAQAAQADENSE